MKAEPYRSPAKDETASSVTIASTQQAQELPTRQREVGVPDGVLPSSLSAEDRFIRSRAHSSTVQDDDVLASSVVLRD